MFPFLLVLFAVAGLSLSIFLILLLLSSPKKCIFSVDDDQSVEIVKFVEAHREILPICSAQGWCLVSSCSGIRCWKKELSFAVIGSPVTVYGCAKVINCSAVTVLNVIADISTWPEWDVWAEGQNVHLEVSEDPALHGDLYMQCDQLVVTTTMVKTKPDVVMYRFGNLECNGVGWILLWNAKRVDWTFYLAQPIDSYSNDIGTSDIDDKCVLTAIWGFDYSDTDDKNMPDKLCAKLNNLSEAITNSHFKIRPFQPLMQSSSSINNPHFPTIHSALSDLPEKPCVLLELEKTRELNILQNCVLAVVPILAEKSANVSSIAGFMLISQLLKKSSNTNSVNNNSVDEKRRSRRRQKVRSDSVTSGSPRMKHLEIEGRRSSSLSAPIVRNKPPELTVTEADEETKLPTRAASHSFLDLIFHRRRSSDTSDKRSKSPTESRSSTPPRERKKTLKKTSSASSQEDLSSSFFHHPMILSHSETSVANHSDVERDSKEIALNFQNITSNVHNVETGQYLFDGKGEALDYKALGNHCIYTLLNENKRASLMDINTPEEEQKRISGGWLFKELNKDVTVLKKTSSFGAYNIISHLCKGIIPSSCKVVWKTLCNPLTRFMYDDTVKKISVLSEFPSGQKLIHMYNESVTFLKKEVQDFCLLQTEKEEGNRLILAFHSVDDKLCPPMKDVLRGTVITSGWVVETVPESPYVSMVSYLMQMIVSSPENQLMEEISNIQSQCINNLSTYLATRPPC